MQTEIACMRELLKGSMDVFKTKDESRSLALLRQWLRERAAGISSSESCVWATSAHVDQVRLHVEDNLNQVANKRMSEGSRDKKALPTFWSRYPWHIMACVGNVACYYLWFTKYSSSCNHLVCFAGAARPTCRGVAEGSMTSSEVPLSSCSHPALYIVLFCRHFTIGLYDPYESYEYVFQLQNPIQSLDIHKCTKN